MLELRNSSTTDTKWSSLSAIYTPQNAPILDSRIIDLQVISEIFSSL